MPEWWTYSLSDFLLFSPRTYYRLIERYNLATWPAHLLALALGVVIPALLRRSTPGRSRTIAAMLMALWAWVGWSFVATRYATINWVAPWLAGLFAVELLLLGWLGVASGRLYFKWESDARSRLGAALFAASLCLYPFLAPASGRGWAQSELFGIAPDPTVLGTIGLLLLARGSRRARLAALTAPVLWCLLSGLTLMAMGSGEAWIVLAKPALGLALSITGSTRPRSGRRSICL